jgi:ribonuclease HI
MTLWRAWHVRNELTHDKKPPPVAASKRFLDSYLQSLLLVEQHPVVDIEKGKQVVDYGLGERRRKNQVGPTVQEKHNWKPPDEGVTKLNIDGAFSNDGRAGAGMILRESNGDIIFAASRQLRSCGDALEAELAAMEEGLRLALYWARKSIILETDSAEAIKLVANGTPNMSRYAMRIKVIRELVREREIGIIKVNREANGASHGLALLGRVHERTAVWLRNSPPEIADAIKTDCTLLSI